MTKTKTFAEVVAELNTQVSAYGDMKLLSIKEDDSEYIFNLESTNGKHEKEVRVNKYFLKLKI